MRKIKLIGLIFVLLLTSCSTQVNTSLDLTMQESRIGFKTDNYDFDGKLNLYIDKNHGEGVPFVDIEEFINFLAPSANEHLIEIDKGIFKIKMVDDSEEYEEVHEGYVQIDFKTNTLTLSDYNAIYYLVPSTAYPEDNFLGFIYDDEELVASSEVVIDLNQYSIPMEMQNDHYYIPLYMANFLYSGYDLEVAYRYTDDYYIFPYSTSDDMTEEHRLPFDDQLMEDESLYDSILQQNMNFMHFLFDNFYGLKVYQDVDSYQKQIEALRIGASKDAIDFDVRFNKFLASLNDLHTSQISPSAYIDESNTFASDALIANIDFRSFINGMNSAGCFIEKDAVQSYEIGQDTIYIEVRNYDGEIKDEIESIMEKYKDKKNVFFDIRCNLGGFIGDMNHLVKYTTNDGWDFYYGDMTNSFTKSNTTTTNKYKTNQNFYFVISGATFSAGNLTASVVKDNELATLVGQTSGGGTAAIGIVTFPDGTTIQMSGATTLLQNSKQKLIEGGANPDIEIDFSILDFSNYEGAIQDIVDQVIK